MSLKIISLCYVKSIGARSTELCRIADYQDGEFLPYTFTPGNEFYAEERDLIYARTASLQVEEGSIGVYEWTTNYQAEQNKWFTETFKSEQSWYEVIITEIRNIDQLVLALKNGFSISGGYDPSHDVILCCRVSDIECDGVYIKKSDALWRGRKLCVKEDVVSIPRVRVDVRHSVGDCKCRFSKLDTRKYLFSLDACRFIGSIELRSKDEIIGEIIRKNIGKDGLGRKERQAAKLALEKLDMPSVTATISTRFQCSYDQAASYAEQYIRRTQEKLDSTTAHRLIELLIENDSDAAQRMRAAIQKQWDETQQEQIEAAQKRQAEADAAFNAIQGQIADAETMLSEMKAQQLEAETRAEKARVLEKQIETEIQKRLEGFKTDYASALVENAAIASITMPVRQSRAEDGENAGHEGWTLILPENTTEVGALDENLDVAVEEWEEICADLEMARGLTLLSFAAYAVKQPLLIVGEAAIRIADLISSSICGQPAIQIYATDAMRNYSNIVHEIEKKPEAVICIVNGLKTGYDHIRGLMQMCPHRMFILTEYHAESLIMEPTSLFTVFIPVFCDYFYTGVQIEKLPEYDCSGELLEKISKLPARSVKEAKGVTSQWFSGAFYPPAVKERCANVLAVMNLLAQMLGLNADRVTALAIEFLFTPLLKCMQKEEFLKTRLEECSVLDHDRKETLISFISRENG